MKRPNRYPYSKQWVESIEEYYNYCDGEPCFQVLRVLENRLTGEIKSEGARMMGMDETVDVEALIGKNVINALATIVFDGAKKVEIPLKLRNGKNYKIIVKEDVE